MVTVIDTIQKTEKPEGRIRFAVRACSWGFVLVAATTRGLCALYLGDDPEALQRTLREEFPQAEFIAGDRAFAGLVAAAVKAVNAPHLGFDLPLDLHGTAFQQRVWRALRRIPPGTTVTYTQLARRLGRPAAVRAVARACAASPLAVAIPCHRVVRRDGALAGYRWGLHRKRALLDREARP